jgi:uncharacterized protein YndB with AHSA1/START domain
MLERHIVIPASQQEVWETLTDPITVSTWFGAEVDWDLSPGGPARFLGDDGAVRDGRVDEVVPDQRLRFRWWPEGEADEETSEVTYLLEPHEDGTDLTITERQLPGTLSAQALSAQALSAMAVAAPAVAAPASGSNAATWTTWDGRLVGVWSRATAPVTIGTR